MKILSHRGYWKQPEEKNTPAAFERSFGLGFGTETDLRDLDGALVIAHDPPRRGCMSAGEFFDIHARTGRALPLALNVKADGLQRLVKAALDAHGVEDSFVFDMSVPDTLHWLRAGVSVFTRHSDVEPEPPLYGDAVGVWLDAFRSDWWSVDTVRGHVDAGKRCCVVSPELHGREHRAVWDLLRASDVVESDLVMICTDLPEDAREVFGHED